MITFYVACGTLLLLASLFFLIPSRRRYEELREQDDGNLTWYRVRERELAAEGDDALKADARLRLLEDAGEDAAPVAESAQRFPRWLLLPLLALLAAGTYYQLGGAQDVEIAAQLAALGEQTTEEQLLETIDVLERRFTQRPDNLHYGALIARFHMGQENYAEALRNYERILEQAPEDPQALAFAAQAQYLAAGRVLDDSARLRAEQALAADPQQSTALGLLGMVSYEQGQYRAAIEYWRRLQATQAPGSESGRVIAGVIAQAQQALAAASGDPLPAAIPDQSAGPGVTVHVTLPEAAALSASDTVFVLARNADGASRMPIAVQRLRGDQFPLTLRLDDGNSMAGQRISDIASVIVSVQVSPDGRPGEDKATWLATSAPVAPSVDGEPLRLELQPR